MERQNQAQSQQNTEISYQSAQPTILVSSSKNFTRATDPSDLQFFCERPMTLNAWTQTTIEDFEHSRTNPNIHNLRPQYQNLNERKLLEKIKVLEDSLRVHAELLSQIHATSGRKNSCQQQKPCPEHRIVSPNSTSLINQVQQPNTESIKYTIIAEGNGHENGEPIEIQLAEEDGAVNFNSSAESGRLEICLTDDHRSNHMDIKNEVLKIEPPSSQYSPTAQFVKRRKIENKSPGIETTPPSSNYFFNEQGLLTPISSHANINYSPVLNLHKTIKTTKNINSNSSSLKETNIDLQTPSNSVGAKLDMENVMVSIGPNNTRIPAKVYENMSWTSASIATRKLLMAIFDRKTLATHSMTGKPSPAFKDHGKPLKQMLNPLIIQDVLFVVTRKCNVSDKEVRNAITTKCADENKMMKLQINKTRTLKDVNKENVS